MKVESWRIYYCMWNALWDFLFPFCGTKYFYHYIVCFFCILQNFHLGLLDAFINNPHNLMLVSSNSSCVKEHKASRKIIVPEKSCIKHVLHHSHWKEQSILLITVNSFSTAGPKKTRNVTFDIARDSVLIWVSFVLMHDIIAVTSILIKVC